MAEHELWSFNNALFFIILLIIIVFITVFGINSVFDVKKINANWATERCNPTIMPLAWLFGHNTKENFEFCMGKIFNTHSMPMFGSITGIFSHFTGLLQMVFDSISSLRNIIASLGGGINVVFQEFTERISTFFFRLRVSAITIKTLIGRMYAIMFSVMYMGLSGIAGMTSFTNTALFGFMDTFCFPADTKINIKNKGLIPIKDIRIGDTIMPSESQVTATFRFYSKGQPMVKLGSVVVSTNHYVKLLGHPIMAGDHPDAIKMGKWTSDEPLYCLNTHDNKIIIDGHEFLDYDETADGDHATMNFIEGRVNAKSIDKDYSFREYCPAISINTRVKTQDGEKEAENVRIGDKLTTGSTVAGLIRRKVGEICVLEDGTRLTPSTLYWNSDTNTWRRIGEKIKCIEEDTEFVSFIVVPNSQIELANGLRIRDYMELCSPDSEMHYSKCLELNSTEFEKKFSTIVI
jgi:hypothetical protein